MISAVYTTPVWQAAQMARNAGPSALAAALVRTRERTLALLDDYAKALGPKLQLPCESGLNPPLWEAGHIAWFQSWWIGRNRQRERGVAAQPEHQRLPAFFEHEDLWFNSSVMPHDERWALGLLSLADTRDYLARTLDQTLACLKCDSDPSTDETLYFYRLVLFHEQMHNEAAVYMAQSCDIPLGPAADGGWFQGSDRHVCSSKDDAIPTQLQWQNRTWQRGWSGPGFAFDNELPGVEVQLDRGQMDSRAVSWRAYLRFVESTRYEMPSVLTKRNGQWLRRVNAQWVTLDMDDVASHLSWFDAQAYCDWADRRLPTEAEWEMAALSLPGFVWSGTWEWTSSDFEPFDGFVAHPYRDYSAPWFGSRKVLKGGSVATDAQMVHPRYRNYFTPERTDIQSGFRTCAKNTPNQPLSSV